MTLGARISGWAVLGVFCLALFTSAALMFSVQPMVGKMLLPIVGGTPAGWIVAMAFFQLALLAGYTIAYGLSRLPAQGHAITYIVLLALGGALLPVHISADSTQHTLDAAGTFILLTLSVGAPFVALSTTSTTLQRLFSATRHPAARDPYFLYAASNLGSFAGLLLYPLLIEPNLTLLRQSESWFGGYGALIALAVMCLLFLGSSGNDSTAETSSHPAASAPLPLQRCLWWVAYAFVPASLLMGYTSFITSDVYSAPLIWVLPLSVYLLTFVVAFRNHRWLSAAKLAPWHIAAVAISFVLIIISATVLRSTLQPIIVHLLAFGSIALAFHLRLYEDRPLGNARQLAAFYLLISLGGALAGIFNAFIAPVIFNSALELPLVLLLSLLLHPRVRERLQTMDYFSTAFSLLTIAAYMLTLRQGGTVSKELLLLAAASLFWATRHPFVLFVAAIIVFSGYTAVSSGDVVARTRNFYGTITVYDRVITDPTTHTQHPVRFIKHGTTTHGLQALEGPDRLRAGAYYHVLTPFFSNPLPAKVLVMGLGAGTMQCLAQPQTDMTYIDIDPGVIHAAQSQFTYLSGCQASNTPRILQGDGRLEIAHLGDETFDIITIDVFSSDYIPAHLMTREALQVYLSHLAQNGILLFHISNEFFDLGPTLATLADDAGLSYRLYQDHKMPDNMYDRPSVWMVMSRHAKRIAPYTAQGWNIPEYPHTARLWTDDYTDYLGVMRKGVFGLDRLLDRPATSQHPKPATTGQ